MLYAARGQLWGAEPRPGGCRTRPQPEQPAPPAEAGRIPLGHSHEESSWCSWRPYKGPVGWPIHVILEYKYILFEGIWGLFLLEYAGICWNMLEYRPCLKRFLLEYSKLEYR